MPKRNQASIDFGPLLPMIDLIAERNGVNRSTVVRLALADWMGRNPTKKIVLVKRSR